MTITSKLGGGIGTPTPIPTAPTPVSTPAQTQTTTYYSTTSDPTPSPTPVTHTPTITPTMSFLNSSTDSEIARAPLNDFTSPSYDLTDNSSRYLDSDSGSYDSGYSSEADISPFFPLRPPHSPAHSSISSVSEAAYSSLNNFATNLTHDYDSSNDMPGYPSDAGSFTSEYSTTSVVHNAQYSDTGSFASDYSNASELSDYPYSERSSIHSDYYSEASTDSSHARSTSNDFATRFRPNDLSIEVPSYPDSDASSFVSDESTPGGSLPVFHGTTRASAHSIRENGFQISKQTNGATEAAGIEDSSVGSHHYFTTDPQIAKAMAAVAAGPDNQPAVVKAMVPPEYRETLKFDEYFDDPDTLMSKYDTPATYITETRNVQGNYDDLTRHLRIGELPDDV